MGFYEEAKQKLTKELPKIGGAKEGAIKHAAMDALLKFAAQEEEFAQAIVQGGSFADCMKKVCAGIGSSISDLEVYKRAAGFYFPGADVRFEMHIELAGEAADADPSTPLRSAQDDSGKKDAAAKGGGLVIDLADFL